VVHPCHPSNSRENRKGRPQSRLTWAKKQDPVSEITRAKSAGGLFQAFECLPDESTALSSNLSPTKKKKSDRCPKKCMKDLSHAAGHFDLNVDTKHTARKKQERQESELESCRSYARFLVHMGFFCSWRVLTW
jgi:hypothetical protein